MISPTASRGLSRRFRSVEDIDAAFVVKDGSGRRHRGNRAYADHRRFNLTALVDQKVQSDDQHSGEQPNCD